MGIVVAVSAIIVLISLFQRLVIISDGEGPELCSRIKTFEAISPHFRSSEHKWERAVLSNQG